MGHSERYPNLPFHFVDVRRRSAGFSTSFQVKLSNIVVTLVIAPECGVILAGLRMEHKSCIESSHLINRS